MGDQAYTATQDKPVEDEKTWLQLENPKAIEFINDVNRSFILSVFFDEPKSISEAAQALEKPFRTMFYLVTKAVDLGLLKFVDTQKRKGRAMKRYRSAADVFFVPYSLMKENFRATLHSMELKCLSSQLDAARAQSSYRRQSWL